MPSWSVMLRRTGMFLLSLVLLATLWETYKWLGPEQGGDIFGWRIIPKTNDRVMPHTWEMLAEFGEPEVRGQDTPVWQAMLGYAWYTLRMSVAGLALGATLGFGLAVVMARFRVVERGLLPYVIVSQTIPLIALAPQVAALGGNFDLPKWTWAAGLAAFLSFLLLLNEGKDLVISHVGYFQSNLDIGCWMLETFRVARNVG